MKTQTEIKAALAAGEHTVVFTKTNGDERTMLCTLKSSLIPAAKPLQEGEVRRTKKPNPDVLAVYDTKAPGWRSFRWDSVKDFY